MDSTSILEISPNNDVHTEVIDEQKEHETRMYSVATTTEEVETEVTNSTTCDIALSIQHIAHTIFSSLSNKDLFNCRFVSYNWKVYSTPSLQSRIKLNVNGFDSSLSGQSHDHELRVNSILELIYLLQQVDPPGTFPCTKFHLQGGPIFDENRDIFLSEYGIYIEDLSLTIHQKPNATVLLEQIKNILTKKAPNIKSFSLSMPSTKFIESTNISPDSSQLLQKDPEFQLIQQNIRFENIFKTKLKFVELRLDVEAIFIEILIQSCPNLQELVLDGRHCELYISPLNRLHLLKRLHFNPLEGRIDKLEKLIQFANVVQKGEGPKLRLRELCLDIEEPQFNWVLELSDWIREYKRHVASVLQNIIQLSESSLEVISWNGMSPGINEKVQFPDIMLQVREFRISNSFFMNNAEREDYEEGMLRLFNHGINFANTFPNLRYVYFHSPSPYAIFRLFWIFLDFNPMPSVEKVDIDWDSSGFVSREDDLQSLQKIFPNATISFLRKLKETENVLEMVFVNEENED